MKFKHPSILAALLVVALLPTQGFAKKPRPNPATDVDCVDCIGTAELEDEAVTTEKLSAQLQQQINQLANLTRVVKDGNGVTFGKVILLLNQNLAAVNYQWQGYDLLLNVFTTGIGIRAGYRVEYWHTNADCSDEPWVWADSFNSSNGVTITGDAYESVAFREDLNSATFNIIGQANPGQTPVTITAVASTDTDGICGQWAPQELSNMVQGIVELTPGFATDHPPPYTVIVE